jgi:HAD superfamily hydrolase (TIGR01509 family)
VPASSASADLDAVVFDWGDTLVSFPGYTTSRQRHVACVQSLFRDLQGSDHAACFAEADIDVRFLAAYEEACARQLRFSRETGREHRLQDRLEATLRGAGCRCPLGEASRTALVERFGALLMAEARLIDGALEVLALLRERYRIGLLANYPWPPLVMATIDRYRLRSHLDAVVISGELGWVKPNPPPFRRVAEALGVEPSRALFVGDDVVNDVRGAKAMGFRTAWIAPGRPPGSEPAADYQLRRLSDLLGSVFPSAVRSRRWRPPG